MITGKELVKSILKDAPLLPGVYIMLNADKKIIYVGKAKKLKVRLSNYIKSNLKERIGRMIYQTCFLQYITTSSEAEALLLEVELIRNNQPSYNILLKKNKAFHYIKLRLDHDYPQLIRIYNREKEVSNDLIFGPFISSEQADLTLNQLQQLFKLRPCNDNYFATQKRPCLQYQIKKCLAPCSNKISKEDYQEIVNQARKFLLGETDLLHKNLVEKMKEMSATDFFEEAAIIRDKLAVLSSFQLSNSLPDEENINFNADIIVLVALNNLHCVQVNLYRDGRRWGSKTYYPKHSKESEAGEIIETFIGHFYQSRMPPAEIIINYEISNSQPIINSLLKLYDKRVSIITPNTDYKLKLVKEAYSHAEPNLHL